MAVSLRFNPLATSDLQEIKNYISDDNPQAAIRTIAEIIDEIEGLKIFPEKGCPLSAKINIVTKYRFLVCGNYLVFYVFEDNVVSIGRVLHGKRDFMNLLEL